MRSCSGMSLAHAQFIRPPRLQYLQCSQVLFTAIYEVTESFWSVAPASVIGGGFPLTNLRLKFSDTPCCFIEYTLLIDARAIIQEADKVRVGHFVIHNSKKILSFILPP